MQQQAGNAPVGGAAVWAGVALALGRLLLFFLLLFLLSLKVHLLQ
jgi:hypothetical protein